MGKLYKYIINLVKWYNGHKLYKFDEQLDDKSLNQSRAPVKKTKTTKNSKNINFKNVELN